MRIVFVNYGHLAHQSEPEQLLDEFHTLTGWAEALLAAGAEVAVVQGFHRRATLERAGVRYEFVPGRFAPHPSRWRIPRRLHREVVRLGPDVVHLNGLLFAVQARSLRRSLPPGSAVVVQHHAEPPSRSAARWIQRWGLSRVDGFFFTGRELARPWLARGLIDPEQPIFEVPEGSTHFRCRDRVENRRATGLEGDPICLWLGNLTPNKDPLTVLDGFARLLERRPAARLYMAYRHGELRAEVEAKIAANPRLQRSVRLLGALRPDEVEAHLNSADLFLQGSHREGSGYALIEALACGAVPVVTDIPSFRYLSDRGAVGALWSPGESSSLAESLDRLLERPLDELRREAVQHFERTLSYEVIARRSLRAYRWLTGRATGPPPAIRTLNPPPLLCPECRLPVDPGELSCASGHRFELRDGVLVLLAEELKLQLRELRPGLREHRDRLERRLFDETVYDSLPEGLAHDFEWRLRGHDLELVRQLLSGRESNTVLDVGSFNGWLAHHLAAAGCEVTAVDFFADPHDGLGARRFYSRADWDSVQMDLRDLSLLNRSFDLVVLNRCLQFFPDPVATLRDAQARVAEHGLLIATGLDFHLLSFRKRRGVERIRRDHFERHGRDLFLFPSRGWLDFGDRRRLRAAGLRIREVRQLQRLNLLSRLRPDRPRFCYGVWLA